MTQDERGAEHESGDNGEGKRRARQMARDAIELMHQSRWAEAEALLSKAYDLVPAPTVALLDARALEKLGKLVEASARYADAEHPPSGEVSAAFREAAEEATRRLAQLRPRIPTLVITAEGGEPASPDFAVSLDGRALSPEERASPIPVNPGQHVLVTSVDDRVPVEDHVVVQEGESKQVGLRAGPPPSPPPAPAPHLESPPAPRSHAARTWGFVSLAVGTAGVAAGITSGLVMLGAKSDLDKECKPGCPSGADSDLSRFRTSRIVSAVGYGVGAAGLATGVLLFVFAPKDEPIRASAGVRVVLGFEKAAVEGSF